MSETDTPTEQVSPWEAYQKLAPAEQALTNKLISCLYHQKLDKEVLAVIEHTLSTGSTENGLTSGSCHAEPKVVVGSRPPLFYLHEVRNAFNTATTVTIVGVGQFRLVAQKVAHLMNEYSGFTKQLKTSSIADGDNPTLWITLTAMAPVPGQSRYGKRMFEEMDEDEFDDRTDDVYDQMMETHARKHGTGKRTVGYKFNYKKGLGCFSCLCRSTIFSIIKYLSMYDMCVMAETSKVFQLYTEDDDIWKKFAKRLSKGNLWFLGTWKATMLNSQRAGNKPKLRINTKPDNQMTKPKVKKTQKEDDGDSSSDSSDSDSDDDRSRYTPKEIARVYVGTGPKSTFDRYTVADYSEVDRIWERRYREWARCNIDLMAEYGAPLYAQGNNQIDRVDMRTLTMEDFKKRYEEPRVPFILTGAMESWPASTLWQEESLKKNFGDRILRAGSGFKMKIKNFLQYANHQRENRPNYLFDDDAFDDNPDLLKHYDPWIPDYFRIDFFNWITKGRPPHQWMVVGPGRTGAAWHTDPWQTSAWNALISGHKRWTLCPPGIIPPGVDGHDNNYTDDYASPKPLQWHLEEKPFLPHDQRLIDVIQGPGEIIFVPSGWWHQVLNLDVTVCCTQNYCNEHNVEDVAMEIGTSPRKWTDQWRETLRQKRPDLFEDGTLDLRFQGIDRTGRHLGKKKKKKGGMMSS